MYYLIYNYILAIKDNTAFQKTLFKVLHENVICVRSNT